MPRLALRPPGHQGGRRAVRPGPARHGPLLDHGHRGRNPDPRHVEDHARARSRSRSASPGSSRRRAPSAAYDRRAQGPTEGPSERRARAAAARPPSAERAGSRTRPVGRAVHRAPPDPRHRRASPRSGPRRSSASRAMPGGSRFLGMVIVALFVIIYYFYELGHPARSPSRGSRSQDELQQVDRRRARLQPLPGQLRALPRRQRRGRHRAGPERPDEAVQPPQRAVPAQRPRRSAGGTSAANPKSVMPVWAERERRAAELRPDRGPDRVPPRAEHAGVSEPRPGAERADPQRGRHRSRHSRAGATRSSSPTPPRRPSRTATAGDGGGATPEPQGTPAPGRGRSSRSRPSTSPSTRPSSTAPADEAFGITSTNDGGARRTTSTSGPPTASAARRQRP